MSQTLETLFHSELLTIRHVRVRPTATECGDIEREAADLLVMPIAGLFAKHDGPGKKLIANSNHALFFGNDKPYRVSFPGGIGDVCIILEFSKAALAGMLSEVAGIENLHSPLIETHCLNSRQRYSIEVYCAASLPSAKQIRWQLKKSASPC